MFKNKYIIAILSFYIFWIGVLPLILTKTAEIVCKNCFVFIRNYYHFIINRIDNKITFLITYLIHYNREDEI